ncbi:MAG TPA: type II/IV secretion system protein, partial [Myxococcaceae bacterium]|nr:type II/IV secretion system protein [Myxococcaceae bacterium]
GVFEMLHVNAEMRDQINAGKSLAELQQCARRAGMRVLREAAVRKLAQGMTSFEEVMRMTAAH